MLGHRHVVVRRFETGASLDSTSVCCVGMPTELRPSLGAGVIVVRLSVTFLLRQDDTEILGS